MTDDSELTTIPLAEIKPADKIRHETFPPELVERMRRVFYRLRPLRGGKLRDWIEEFKHDADPESEVAFWEALMDHLDKYPEASISEKREAMRAILAKSMGVHVDPETGQEVAEVRVVDDPDTLPPAWLVNPGDAGEQ